MVWEWGEVSGFFYSFCVFRQAAEASDPTWSQLWPAGSQATLAHRVRVPHPGTQHLLQTSQARSVFTWCRYNLYILYLPAIQERKGPALEEKSLIFKNRFWESENSWKEGGGPVIQQGFLVRLLRWLSVKTTYCLSFLQEDPSIQTAGTYYMYLPAGSISPGGNAFRSRLIRSKFYSMLPGPGRFFGQFCTISDQETVCSLVVLNKKERLKLGRESPEGLKML